MPTISAITTERTNIRSTPAGDEVLGSIAKDIHVTATDNGGQWLLLQTVNNTPRGGWINARSVRVTVTQPPPPPPTPTTEAVHTIIINPNGTLKIDGVDYA